MILPNNIIDDIIVYKKENGLIHAYLNQKALDIYLYNRAKELTNNFKIKEEYDDEKFKRNLNIDDLPNIRHTVCNKPLNNGEFVKENEIVIVVGLDSVDEYLRKNNISQLNTSLCVGVKIYSKYEGYITNHINDTFVGSCNLGNKIKDGDLLFTIQPSEKPNTQQTLPYDIKFEYKMLSREFLDCIPYLSDISINKSLVGNFSYVEKGDEILEVQEFTHYEPRFKCTIKAPCSGIFVFKYKSHVSKLKKGDLLFSVYHDYAQLKECYPNKISTYTDDFSNKVIIKGKEYGGNWFGFKMGSIYFKLEYFSQKKFLVLHFDRREITLNNKCSLHILLENGIIITLNAENNPIKIDNINYEIKYLLKEESAIMLEHEKFIKWQITNEEGVAIIKGENNCFTDKNDRTGLSKRLSHEIFQDFIVEFNYATKEDLLKSSTFENINVNKKDSKCYVYLMIDLTNKFYKIGISNNPRYREHTLQSDKPTIELICAKEYPTRSIAEAIESSLHKVYANKRIRGEWFNLTEDDVKVISKTLND